MLRASGISRHGAVEELLPYLVDPGIPEISIQHAMVSPHNQFESPIR